VTDILTLKTQEKGIELLVQYTSGPPPSVLGDPVRFKQILLNLVGNAVKFTSSGHVLIRIGFELMAKKEVLLHVAVEDTGAGIPQDKLHYIFRKFSQAEESTTRKFGGTGLGLTICNRLVKMMNGKMQVKSELGKGSLFSFDIHLPCGMQKNSAKLPAADLKDLRVLVVDDYVANFAILKSYLDNLGMHGDTVTTIAKARRAIKLAQDKKAPYHFIILDYKTGSDNSLEFAREIKASSPPKNMPFVVLMASASLGSAEAMLAHDISAFFVKPVYPQQLEATFKILRHAKMAKQRLPLITRYTLAKLVETDENKKHKKKISFDGRRVLVVEDMDVNLMLMLKVLEKLGCNADGAVSGPEAIDRMHRSDYALVFMDCQMPDMDGYETTQKIRKEESAKNKHTPIVALTADAMTGDREKCLNAGMDDYLNKPFKPTQIEDMLQKWAH